MPLSKTEEPCSCGVLQRAAEDERIPVKFDPEMNEFSLVYGPDGKGSMMMRHCFFCGGKAPESQRPSAFTHITKEERWRLVDLTKPLKTLEEVFAALGNPDTDREAGSIITYPEKDRKSEETTYYRVLSYRSLSKVADVRVTVYPQGQVSFVISGKPLSRRADQE